MRSIHQPLQSKCTTNPKDYYLQIDCSYSLVIIKPWKPFFSKCHFLAISFTQTILVLRGFFYLHPLLHYPTLGRSLKGVICLTLTVLPSFKGVVCSCTLLHYPTKRGWFTLTLFCTTPPWGITHFTRTLVVRYGGQQCFFNVVCIFCVQLIVWVLTHTDAGSAKTCLWYKHKTSTAFIWHHYQSSIQIRYSFKGWFFSLSLSSILPYLKHFKLTLITPSSLYKAQSMSFWLKYRL